MKTYHLDVTRVTTYAVKAESPEDVIDNFLDAEDPESLDIGGETLDMEVIDPMADLPVALNKEPMN
jgi:hypothetical protein